jgi:hypothetical protein
MVHDPINSPSHYTFSELEPIEAIEAWGLGYHLGNVVKYVVRADHKGASLQDLRKAAWYLNREIQRRARYAQVNGEADPCTTPSSRPSAPPGR